jgi:hypothetical protein
MRSNSIYFLLGTMLLGCLFCPCARGQENMQVSTKLCDSLVQAIKNDNLMLQGADVQIENAPACFAGAASGYGLQPARVSLLNALVNFSNGQQQGSSLSSSGSTNAVTKPSGPTAIAEEYGGLSSSSGTSSMTFQFAPGTLLTNLALTGVRPICDAVITTNCTSPSWVRALKGLTFKVTSNTSTGSQSLTGTPAPMTPSTGSTSTQVSLTSHGTTEPTFGGFTVQYAFKKSKTPAAATASGAAGITKGSAGSNDPKVYPDMLQALVQLSRTLSSCANYKDWQDAAKKNISDANQRSGDSLSAVIVHEYRKIAQELLNGSACPNARPALQNFYEKALEAEAYEDYSDVNPGSTAPAAAIEYDLNTPQNQQSYSSVKASGTLQWHFKKVNESQTPTAAGGSRKSPAALQNWVEKTANALANGTPGEGASMQAKSAAADLTPPWSLNAMLEADVYNSSPPSSVPSATHLRDVQAGAELTRTFSPSTKSGSFRKLIGPVDVSAAYSYQDQTSPSLLKGLPSTITFVGLPSSTTAVYAKRGPISLGQVKLGFGKGTKISFPVAVSYSNRTELITHPKVGLQIGLSYNLSSLFGGSTASK